MRGKVGQCSLRKARTCHPTTHTCLATKGAASATDSSPVTSRTSMSGSGAAACCALGAGTLTGMVPAAPAEAQARRWQRRGAGVVGAALLHDTILGAACRHHCQEDSGG